VNTKTEAITYIRGLEFVVDQWKNLPGRREEGPTMAREFTFSI